MAIERLNFVSILEEFKWDHELKKWALKCDIRIDSSNVDLIPNSTTWYVLVTPDYPWGSIKFCPSIDGGIVHTFHHQNYNGNRSHLSEWTSGSLCLDTTNHALNRIAMDTEPFEPSQRLKWHFRRAQQWLIKASSLTLVLKDDDFELPEFHGAAYTPERLVFSEPDQSISFWEKIDQSSGLVSYFKMFDDKELQKISDPFIIREFLDEKGNILSTNDWGDIFPSEDRNGKQLPSMQGIWILAPDVPVVHPWQAPGNWGELCQVFANCGRDLLSEIHQLASKLRNGFPLLIAVGFPIPSKFENEPNKIHWQGILIPPLSRGVHYAPGFRANELGYRTLDYTKYFNPGAPLRWIRSQNWSEDEIRTRGKLPAQVTDKTITLIGAGAIGSAIAEILVRAGVTKLVIIDDEKIDIGNLSRHTMTIADVGFRKVIKLAARLRRLSPHANIHPIVDFFPPTDLVEQDVIRTTDLIVDCTGSDSVLHALSSFQWKKEKLFLSISIGAKAERIFAYINRSDKFAVEDMQQKLSPWLIEELDKMKDEGFPREYTGCWHSVFPARMDDIMMAASASIRIMEKALEVPAAHKQLVVLEKEMSGYSTGYAEAKK